MVETAQKSDLSLTAPRKLGPPVPRRAGCRTRVRPRAVQPEWHDDTCTSANRKLQETARFLQRDPNNPWLRGKLCKEKKNYQKLVKQQQGKFVSKMFEQLDELKGNDPKKYMQIVKKIRDGNFDKRNSCDSDSISPEAWRDHFSGLLGPKVGAKKEHEDYIQANIDKCNAIFEAPLTKVEILEAIKNLKNGKSTSFDLVSNEMIKAIQFLNFSIQ